MARQRAADEWSQSVTVTTRPQPGRITKTGAKDQSVGQLVSAVSDNVSKLVQGEIELAKLELRSTIKNAGTGIGMFAGAAVVLIFSLTFGFLALAEGIAALGLDRWLAFLIVFAFQLLVVAVLAFLGIKKVKQVKAPQRTIATSKETVAYLKNHG